MKNTLLPAILLLGVICIPVAVRVTAMSRRIWTYECYASLSAAVAGLNALNEEQQLNASFVTTAYEGAHNPYCMVFTR